MTTERDRALETALGQIERAHGKGAIMRLGEVQAQPIDIIPTGEIWARADDTEQASYVNGALVTCSRTARSGRRTPIRSRRRGSRWQSARP